MAKKPKGPSKNEDDEFTKTRFLSTEESRHLQESIDISRNRPASLRILEGSQKGRRFELILEKLTIGREASCEIWLDDSAASRKHAEIIVEKEGAIVLIRDLGSRNGISINDIKVKETVLRHADVIQIGKTLIRFNAKGTIDQVAEENLVKSSNHDDLTGLANKRFIEESLAQELKLAANSRKEVCLLLFDVDHFKQINDNYGHLAGDYVLATIPQVLDASIIPPTCTFGRWGGEEFVVVYPESTLEDCVRLSENIRSTLEAYDFCYNSEHLPITVSVGCTHSGLNPNVKPQDIFTKADAAMYLAKNTGRNKVCSKS